MEEKVGFLPQFFKLGNLGILNTDRSTSVQVLLGCVPVFQKLLKRCWFFLQLPLVVLEVCETSWVYCLS